MNVDMVTTRDLQAWFDGMDAAPRTVRNFRSHASTLFQFAEARGYIAKGDNPVTGTEQIKSKNASPIEIYSPKEIRKLLAAAPGDFQPIIAIQAFAGLRSAEVMRLQWQDVKLERGHIEITAGNAKTARRQKIEGETVKTNLMQWQIKARKASACGLRNPRASVLECGSPLPLLNASQLSKAPEGWRSLKAGAIYCLMDTDKNKPGGKIILYQMKYAVSQVVK